LIEPEPKLTSKN